jgi:uncharacterized protein involved in exopolysaccharide biosynthesis
LTPVQPYLGTARRFRWLLATILILVWGVGLGAAWLEYANTFESEATVWVVRAAPALSVTDPDDPSIALIQTAAAQQAEVLKQLLRTRSFLSEVVARTTLRAAYETAPDQREFLDDIQKHFQVETLGTSLIGVSFTAQDPRVPPELIKAALALRTERLEQARLASAAALNTLYQRQLQFEEGQALEAQRALDEFNQSHSAPLSDVDEHRQGQRRLALDYAVVLVGEMRARIQRAQLAPALLEVSGIEFQVVDEPIVATTPGGGERSAVLIGAVALLAGAGLATLLVLVATLLGDRVARPAEVGGTVTGGRVAQRT